MATEGNIPEDVSAMNTGVKGRYSTMAQLGSNLKECFPEESIKPSSGLSQYSQCSESSAEAENKEREDYVMIRSPEDQSSVESYSHEKLPTENISKSEPCEADKMENQAQTQITENEKQHQKGVLSKDVETRDDKVEAINDINIEETDHDKEDDGAKIPRPACAEELNPKVHEEESSVDNSSLDQHLERITDQHASLKVIPESIVNEENTRSKGEEVAALECNEQATSVSETNLDLVNEAILPNLDLKTKSQGEENERVIGSYTKDEDTETTIHVEDEIKEIYLTGVQNKKADRPFVPEGEWKDPESIGSSNKLEHDNNREEDASTANVAQNPHIHDVEEFTFEAASGKGENDNDNSEEQDGGKKDSWQKNELEDEDREQLILIPEETEIAASRENAEKRVEQNKHPVENFEEKEEKDGGETSISTDKSLPLAESIEEIKSEKSIFPPKNANDLNSEGPLVEETVQPDRGEIGIISETEAEEKHQESSKFCTENNEQDQHCSETQSTENLNIKHTDSETMVTTETITRSTMDIEEHEKVPESNSEEKIGIKVDEKIIPEEPKEMEEATNKQSHETAKESASDDETPSRLYIAALISEETIDQSIGEESLKDGESTLVEKNDSHKPEDAEEEKQLIRDETITSLISDEIIEQSIEEESLKDGQSTLTEKNDSHKPEDDEEEKNAAELWKQAIDLPKSTGGQETGKKQIIEGSVDETKNNFEDNENEIQCSRDDTGREFKEENYVMDLPPEFIQNTELEEKHSTIIQLDSNPKECSLTESESSVESSSAHKSPTENICRTEHSLADKTENKELPETSENERQNKMGLQIKDVETGGDKVEVINDLSDMKTKSQGEEDERERESSIKDEDTNSTKHVEDEFSEICLAGEQNKEAEMPSALEGERKKDPEPIGSNDNLEHENNREEDASAENVAQSPCVRRVEESPFEASSRNGDNDDDKSESESSNLDTDRGSTKVAIEAGETQQETSYTAEKDKNEDIYESEWQQNDVCPVDKKAEEDDLACLNRDVRGAHEEGLTETNEVGKINPESQGGENRESRHKNEQEVELGEQVILIPEKIEIAAPRANAKNGVEQNIQLIEKFEETEHTEKSLPLAESIIEIKSEKRIFPPTIASDLNSEGPLIEETGQPDSGETGEVSKTEVEDKHQESNEFFIENNEQDDHCSEKQSIENLAIKHTDLEATVTTETITKSTKDAEELQKVSESLSEEKIDIKDEEKIIPEEPKETEGATYKQSQETAKESASEDEASTLPTTALISDEMIEQSIEEESLMDGESTLVEKNDSHKQENDAEEKKKDPEAFDQPKSTCEQETDKQQIMEGSVEETKNHFEDNEKEIQCSRDDTGREVKEENYVIDLPPEFIQDTGPEERYPTAVQLDSNPKECLPAESEGSVESFSAEKSLTENISRPEHFLADKEENEELTEISENESKNQEGLQIKDAEKEGDKVEAIIDKNIEEPDHGIENDSAKISMLTFAEEPNLKVHEEETSTEISFIDQHLELTDQEASFKVIPESVVKDENTISKGEEDAVLEYNLQATGISKTNLGLVNEALLPNLDLKTKSQGEEDERDIESGTKDEHRICLTGEQNKEAEMPSVLEDEWKKDPEPNGPSDNLELENNREEDACAENVAQSPCIQRVEESNFEAASRNGDNDDDKSEDKSSNQVTDGGSTDDKDKNNDIYESEWQQTDVHPVDKMAKAEDLACLNRDVREAHEEGRAETNDKSKNQSSNLVADETSTQVTIEAGETLQEASYTACKDKNKDVFESVRQEIDVLPVEDSACLNRDVRAAKEDDIIQMGLTETYENDKTNPAKHDEEKRDSWQKNEQEDELGEQVIMIPEKTEIAAPIDNAEKIVQQGVHPAENFDEKEEKDEPTSIHDTRETSIPTEKSLPLVEPVTKTKSEELNSKYLLVEEAGQPDSDETGEVSKTDAEETHQEPGKFSTENNKQDELHSETQSTENFAVKPMDSEAKVTTETITKSTKDTEELQKVTESHSEEKMDIKGDEKITPEEPKDMEEVTDNQSHETATESVSEDEAPSRLSIEESIRDETVEQSFQEESLHGELTFIEESHRPDIDAEENIKAIEVDAFDLPKTTGVQDTSKQQIIEGSLEEKMNNFQENEKEIQSSMEDTSREIIEMSCIPDLPPEFIKKAELGEKYLMTAQLDSNPNECSSAESKSSVEPSSPDISPTENIHTSEHFQADKIENQPLTNLSEHESQHQNGAACKDVETGSDKVEAIIEQNIEQDHDHCIENDGAKIQQLACAEKTNPKVHEEETSIDNTSLDRHLELITDQLATSKVIAERMEKEMITPHTNENTRSKREENADLECNEQATSISKTNLGLVNEALLPNLDLKTKSQGEEADRVIQSCTIVEDTDATINAEDEFNEKSLAGVENKKVEILSVSEDEGKDPESIRSSDKLEHEDDREEDASTENAAQTPFPHKVEESTIEAASRNRNEDGDNSAIPSSNLITDGTNTPVKIDTTETLQEPSQTACQDKNKDIHESAWEEVDIPPVDRMAKEEDSACLIKGVRGASEEDIIQTGLIESNEDSKIDTEKCDGEKIDTRQNNEEENELEEQVTLIPEKTEIASQTEDAEKGVEENIHPGEISDEKEEKDKLTSTPVIGETSISTEKSFPPVESITKIKSEERTFPQIIVNDLNSKDPSIEGTGQSDSGEISEVSKTEAKEKHQESSKFSTENNKQDEHCSETQSTENLVIKHTDLEAMVTTEIITKSSKDAEEPERVPESHSEEKKDIKGDEKIIPEEPKEMDKATDVLSVETETPLITHTEGASILGSSDNDKEKEMEYSNEGIQKQKDGGQPMPPDLKTENISESDTGYIIEGKREQVDSLADQNEVCKTETVEDEKSMTEVTKNIEVYTSMNSRKALLQEEEPADKTEDSLAVTGVEREAEELKAASLSSEEEFVNTKARELLMEKGASVSVTQDQSENTLLHSQSVQQVIKLRFQDDIEPNMKDKELSNLPLDQDEDTKDIEFTQEVHQRLGTANNDDNFNEHPTEDRITSPEEETGNEVEVSTSEFTEHIESTNLTEEKKPVTLEDHTEQNIDITDFSALKFMHESETCTEVSSSTSKVYEKETEVGFIKRDDPTSGDPKNVPAVDEIEEMDLKKAESGHVEHDKGSDIAIKSKGETAIATNETTSDHIDNTEREEEKSKPEKKGILVELNGGHLMIDSCVEETDKTTTVQDERELATSSIPISQDYPKQLVEEKDAMHNGEGYLVHSSENTSLQKEHEVVKLGDVSELESVEITNECSNEDISKLENEGLHMVSDQKTNNRISDTTNVARHDDTCKLHTGKEEKFLIEASKCTVSSTYKDNEAMQGQENLATSFEGSLTSVAKEKAANASETKDFSHENEPTDEFPSEKTVEAADTSEEVELACKPTAKDQSDEKIHEAEEESNSEDHVFESTENVPGQNFQGEIHREVNKQFEVEHHTGIPIDAHEASVTDGCTENVLEETEKANGSKNILEHTQQPKSSLKEPDALSAEYDIVNEATTSLEERESRILENLAKANDNFSSLTAIEALEEGTHKEESEKTLSRKASMGSQGVEKDIKAEILNKDVNIDTDNIQEESSNSEDSRDKQSSEIVGEGGQEIYQDTRDKALKSGDEHEKEEDISLTLIPKNNLQSHSLLQTEDDPPKNKFSISVDNLASDDQIYENAETTFVVDETEKKLPQSSHDVSKPEASPVLEIAATEKENANKKIQKQEDEDLCDLNSQETISDTKDVKISRTEKGSGVTDQKKPCIEASKYILDATSTNVEQEAENFRSSSKIIVAEKIETESDSGDQSNIHESTMTKESELPEEKILEPDNLCKLESPTDSKVHYETNDQLPHTMEKSNNIQDCTSEFVEHFQEITYESENHIELEPQMKAEHDLNIPVQDKETLVTSMITKEVHDGVGENIDIKIINYDNSVELQTLSGRDETVNQVKDHNSISTRDLKPAESGKHKAIVDLIIEDDATRKEASSSIEANKDNMLDKGDWRPIDDPTAGPQVLEGKLEKKIEAEGDNCIIVTETKPDEVQKVESSTREAQLDKPMEGCNLNKQCAETIKIKPSLQVEEVVGMKDEKNSPNSCGQLPQPFNENAGRKIPFPESSVVEFKDEDVDVSEQTPAVIDQNEEETQGSSEREPRHNRAGVEAILKDKTIDDQFHLTGNSEEKLQTSRTQIYEDSQKDGSNEVHEKGGAPEVVMQLERQEKGEKEKADSLIESEQKKEAMASEEAANLRTIEKTFEFVPEVHSYEVLMESEEKEKHIKRALTNMQPEENQSEITIAAGKTINTQVSDEKIKEEQEAAKDFQQIYVAERDRTRDQETEQSAVEYPIKKTNETLQTSSHDNQHEVKSEAIEEIVYENIKDNLPKDVTVAAKSVAHENQGTETKITGGRTEVVAPGEKESGVTVDSSHKGHMDTAEVCECTREEIQKLEESSWEKVDINLTEKADVETRKINDEGVQHWPQEAEEPLQVDIHLDDEATAKIDSEKQDGEDENQKLEPLSGASSAMVETSKDKEVKVAHKKSHNILSGVGSKVKHSISKVKKAITGKSSHPKTPSPK